MASYPKKVGMNMMKKLQRAVAILLVIASFAVLMPVSLAASYTGTVNSDKVFFRTKASTNSGYHALLKKGTGVTVTGTSGNFYAVTYNKKTGFIMKKFVTLPADAQTALNGASGAKTTTTTQSASAKTSKYASAKKIADLGTVPAATKKGSSGDAVEKLQQALKIKGFYSAKVDGKYGSGTEYSVRRFQKSVGLTVTGVADRDTLSVLFGKATVASLKKSSAAQKTTTVASDPQMKGITKISQITVPATSTKGNTGKNVLALQQALKIKGYYKAAINSKYDDNTVAAVKAFQKAKKLTADGIAGFSTIKALFGKNAANYTTYKTERLNWFNGGAGRIPNGAIFQVKDVLTGKTFSCKRLFGSNHMDSEPLSTSDAKTLKSIYGNKYSWNRRAILVKYNGRVYAASMNGMPHGTSTINNGWPGHFCIHFYGSKTHETKKVDSAHQNAVSRAMNATW